MIYELVYTSARRGLKPGSRGFCTVAHTEGMPPNAIQVAESLSGYRNLYQPHDRNYPLNPVAYSHFVVRVGREDVSILSRVAACSTDYSGRTNKLAHHVLLAAADAVEAGPAAAMLQPGFFIEEWDRDPTLLPARSALNVASTPSFAATGWQQQCGDAGWAGVLAQACLETGAGESYIVFQPGQALLLPLIEEALRLVPPAFRWRVTFSTYFSSAPSGSGCLWRCCVKGSDAHRAARSRRGARIIDLTDPPGTATEDGELVHCARTGEPPAWTRERARPRAPEVADRGAATRAVAGVPGETPADDSMEVTAAEPLAIPKPRKRAVIKRAHSEGATAAVEPPKAGLGPASYVGFGLAGAVVILAVMVFSGFFDRGTRQPVPPPPVARPPSGPPEVRPVTPENAADPATPAIPRMPTESVVTSAISRTTAPTNVAVAQVEQAPAPAKPTWDLRRTTALVRGMKTIRDSQPPWEIPLPAESAWYGRRCVFFGHDGPLEQAASTRDVDRLRNLVREIRYDVGPGALSVTYKAGSLTLAGPPDATAAIPRLPVCALLERGDGDPRDLLVWLRELAVDDARAVTEPSAVLVSVPMTATLELAGRILRTESLMCMVAFKGTDLRRPAPFDVSPSGDNLVITLRLDAAERERIARVIAWQRGKSASPAPGPAEADPASVRPAPPASEPAGILDYAGLRARLDAIRRSAGDGLQVLSAVKRSLIMRDLRTLLVEGCEEPLAAAGAGHADATWVTDRLEAVRELIEEEVSGSGPRRHRHNRDSRRVLGGGGGGNEDVSESSGDRAAYFAEVLLPSNRAMTSSSLKRIVHAEELDELLTRRSPPDGDAAGGRRRFEEDDVFVQPVAEPAEHTLDPDGVVVTRLSFHPRDASWECLLSIDCHDEGGAR